MRWVKVSQVVIEKGDVWMIREPLSGVEWPSRNGNKEPAAKLVYAQNPVDVEVKQSLLEAYGIPSFAELPNQGFFSQVIFGSPMLGATLFVPESRLEEALSILEAEVEQNPDEAFDFFGEEEEGTGEADDGNVGDDGNEADGADADE
jgi:hypothetical protein